MREFWLVWNPLGGSPTHQHPSLHLAKTEAERLARQNPGQDFFVLQTCGLARKTDVEWIPINVDEPPF